MTPGQDAFWKLPETVAARRDLSPSDKLVWAYLRDRQARGKGIPGLRGIAGDTGQSVGAVRRAVACLEEKGLITVDRIERNPAGRKNSYRVQNGHVSETDTCQDRPEHVSETSTYTCPKRTHPTEQTAEKKKKNAREGDPLVWSIEGGWQGITDADRAEWGPQAYPSCDLDRELAQMSAWLRANPDKAHRKNWRRFIVNWLTRSQERRGSHAKVQPRAPARLKEDVPVRVLNA